MNALNAFLAQSTLDEHIRRAEAHRRLAVAEKETQTPHYDAVTIRRATPDDWVAVERLAALEGRPEAPPGRALLAEVDGHVLAAIWLEAGTTLADPFHPTAELVGLLQERAKQLGHRQGLVTRPLRRAAARVTAIARH